MKRFFAPSCAARNQPCADCVNLFALPGIHVFLRSDGKDLLRRANRYSDSIKPAAFGRPEQAFSSLRRVPAGAPAIGRSFHVRRHSLPGIRPLLAALLAAAVPFF
jgi:hypothetical protein